MRIAIVGAGPGGLAAAHALQTRFRPQPEILLLEASAQAGGLAAGFRGSPAWEWPLELYYHHLFTNDRAIIELTRELGLAHLLEIHAPVAAYLYAGQIHRLGTIGQFLAFPHLSWPLKLRMGLAMAYLRWHPRPPWHRFDEVTAHAWLRTRMGPRAYAALWQPLLEAKFGPRYQEVPLAWFAARLYKRTAHLGYFKGGFQAWSDAFLALVRQNGACAEFKTRVTGIVRTRAAWQVQAADRTWDAQAVLHTGSPRLLAEACPLLPASFAQRIQSETYMGAVVLTVALDRSLTEGIYWINVPASARLPFLVVVEHTAMIPPARYGGQHLVYLGAYVEPDHRYLHMDAEALTQEFLEGLPRLNPAFRMSQVQASWLHRTRFAQPVPALGGGQRRLPLRTPVPGLYLATMSQVWPWDRGTNYAVDIGQRAARAIGQDLGLHPI